MVRMIAVLSVLLLWVSGPAGWAGEPQAVGMTHSLGYTRIFSDGSGESHFEDLTMEFSPMEFSPHLPPVLASGMASTGGMVVLSAPADGVADWHPVPRRQVNVILSGQVEIEVSDGERRTFGPGAYILGEDTAGKGHIARVVGDEDAYFVVIALQETSSP